MSTKLFVDINLDSIRADLDASYSPGEFHCDVIKNGIPNIYQLLIEVDEIPKGKDYIIVSVALAGSFDNQVLETIHEEYLIYKPTTNKRKGHFLSKDKKDTTEFFPFLKDMVKAK